MICIQKELQAHCCLYDGIGIAYNLEKRMAAFTMASASFESKLMLGTLRKR